MIYGDNIREPDLLRGNQKVFNFEKDRGSVSDISSGVFEDKTDVTFLWGISKKLEVDSL